MRWSWVCGLVLLAGCLGGGEVWRADAPLAPGWAFRMALHDADGAVGAWLEVDARGGVYNYVASSGRPPEPHLVIGEDWEVRQAQTGRVLFRLRPEDGRLVLTETGHIGQDLDCVLTVDATLECRHGDQALHYRAEGGWIVRTWPAPALLHRLEPHPTTGDQRLRALFLFAMFAIETDTDAHDGDACCMSLPP